jgi:hypothetical protein
MDEVLLGVTFKTAVIQATVTVTVYGGIATLGSTAN